MQDLVDAEENVTSLQLCKSQLEIALNEISLTLGDDDGKEKKALIAKSILEQRWFFFKNKPSVFFDRKSGLLWANLDYFSYLKDDATAYRYEEAVCLLAGLILDGQDQWQMPTLTEIRFALEEQNFPFQESNYNDHDIKKREECYIQKKGDNDIVYLNSSYPEVGMGMVGMGMGVSMGIGGGIFGFVVHTPILMPCCHALTTNGYAHDVADDNKVFTPQERALKTLAIFEKNGLEPIFDDPQMTTLYRELYIERPALLQALADVEAKLAAFQEEPGGRAFRPASFDYRTLLAEYDIAAIDNSIIQYYAAVEKWITQIFTMIESNEQGNTDFFASAHALNALLRQKRKLSALLTEDEQILLVGRRKRLEDACAANFDGLKDKLMKVKTQVACFDQRLKEINEGENSIHELACLDNEPRAAFTLLAENTAQLVKQDLFRLEYIEDNLDALQQLAAVEEQWTSEYELFISKGCSDFSAACEEEGIQAEHVQLWMSDWRKLRLLLERKVSLLIDLTLCQELPMEITATLLETLTAFRKKINEFYVLERKGIHQKYAFVPGGDVQEKFEQEHELFKLMIVLQEQIQQTIFSCDHSLTRATILNWANELFSLPVEDVLAFVEDRHFDVIAKEILDDFTKLRESNYKTFLNDAAAYAAERKEREKQYTALMFKMRSCLKQ